MKLPLLNGTIDRRILVNYKANPDVGRKLLPHPFEPLIINGYASVGICLLRLKGIGIQSSPHFTRINSENVAHRILIKFFLDGEETHGVYIPRRDTDSLLNVWLAGRLLSWPHYSATFKVKEDNEHYDIKIDSTDGETSLHLEAHRTNEFPEHSMFDSIDHASTSFRECPIGISPSASAHEYKVVQLNTKSWSVKPLSISKLRSNYFDNQSRFPEGSIQFDNALLMEQIEHQWHDNGIFRLPLPEKTFAN